MKIVGSLVDALKTNRPMTLRHHNPYVEEAAAIGENLITQHELKTTPDILTTRQINKNLIIEVGCYFGKTLIELAQLNPNNSILGLDITYKRVVKTARRIKQSNLKNAHVALCDGTFLFKDILQNKTLKGVCIFFPDPWLKNKQGKNRLLNENFIDLLFDKLQPGGFFWLKTNHEPYFLNTQFLLSKKGFILDAAVPPHALNVGRYETEFQKLFTQKQIPFFEGVYLKPNETQIASTP